MGTASHMLHMYGLFTYMNGLNLWDTYAIWEVDGATPMSWFIMAPY